MKIAITQMNTTIGDFDGNIQKMLHFQDEALEKSCRLIIYPYNSLTGFPLDGLVQHNDFIQMTQKKIDEFVSKSKMDSVVIVPSPVKAKDDSIAILSHIVLVSDNQFKILGVQPLSQNGGFFPVEYMGYTFIIALNSQFNGKGEIKDVDVASEICALPSFAKVSSSPARGDISRGAYIASELDSYFAHVNMVGCNDSLISGGESYACNPDGTFLAAASIDKEEMFVMSLDRTHIDSMELKDFKLDNNEILWRHLCLSIRDFVQKSGFSDVCLGISGGLDSAVVAALAADSLGSQHVHGILLPGPYTSEESVEDALKLCENLSIKTLNFNINSTFDTTLKALGNIKQLTEENLQARTRALFIMAASNEYGWFVLNTTNKSEAAMGFSTLYGDTIGSFAPLASLYKTDVYVLARYRAEISKSIPENIINKPPSSELYEGALDCDRLPDYDILDKILISHLEAGEGLDLIAKKGFDKDLVKSILTSVSKSEFKRRQEPISPMLGNIHLNTGRAWPITNKWSYFE